MKIPITDQFLWMIYNFFEKTGEILEPPEIFKLKGFRDIMPDSIGKQVWRELEKKRNKRQFARFISYLKKRECIKIANLKAKKGILLTSKGKQKALKVKYRLLNKKRRKDGKWIMLIFDIPERKRDLRALLRETLYLLEYKMFQQSVWICPHDVLKETEDFIQRNLLDSYVKLFLIEEIEINKKE